MKKKTNRGAKKRKACQGHQSFDNDRMKAKSVHEVLGEQKLSAGMKLEFTTRVHIRVEHCIHQPQRM